MGRHFLCTFILVITSLSVVACGAKTGLEVPDTGLDARVDGDAGLDAPETDVPCVVLEPDAGPIELPLDTQVQVGRADVLFLIDVTASMGQEIDQIRGNLRDRIVPGIQDAIPDARLGVATFADFPQNPCGDPGDLPFRQILPFTTEINRVQGAVDALTLGSGRDEPEAQVEALFQAATGMGLSPLIPPTFGCRNTEFGYPCFRNDALPVILLFSDAAFHNGPGGANPYECGAANRAHSYADAQRALNERRIRVMGLYSGPGGEGVDHLRAIARDTGAINGTEPIVFDIGTRGQRLSESVIQSIRTLADVVRFDIDLVLVDPNPSDGVDPRNFVDRILAIEARPASGAVSVDREAGVFRSVETGTSVVFMLVLRNDAVAPGVGPQRFRLDIVFRGDERTRLGERSIEIVIPGTEGGTC